MMSNITHADLYSLCQNYIVAHDKYNHTLAANDFASANAEAIAIREFFAVGNNGGCIPEGWKAERDGYRIVVMTPEKIKITICKIAESFELVVLYDFLDAMLCELPEIDREHS